MHSSLNGRLAAALILALIAGSAGSAPAHAADLALAETGRIEVNAMEYPWSAIGRVNAGGRGHCTGFLIGKRQVLTAAHCLYDVRNGRWRAASDTQRATPSLSERNTKEREIAISFPDGG